MLANVIRKRAHATLLTQAKRFGSTGPVNYSNVHIHNVQDLFKAETSELHEPRPGRVMNPGESARDLDIALSFVQADLDKLGASITDPDEKKCFENAFRPLFAEPAKEELEGGLKGAHFIPKARAPYGLLAGRLLGAAVVGASILSLFYESLSRSYKFYKNIEHPHEH